MREPDPATAPTEVKRAASRGSQAPSDEDIPMVTERRCKSRLRLPVDDEEECDGVQDRPGERRRPAAECSRERLAAIFDRGRRWPTT